MARGGEEEVVAEAAVVGLDGGGRASIRVCLSLCSICRGVLQGGHFGCVGLAFLGIEDGVVVKSN